VLPAVFMALAGVTIVLGLAALWQSLRTAFGGGPEAFAGGDVGLPERAALLAEKQTLLRAIKDIAFEKELGKISEEDFVRLDKAYRRRAKRVLHLLDQDIEPFLLKAEAEIADAMSEDEDRGPYRRGGSVKRKKKSKGVAVAKGKTKPAPKPVEEPFKLVCPVCAMRNDADALHCKDCAARIAPVACPRCDTHNDPDAKFCKSCAEPLGSAKAPEEEE